MTSLQSQYLLCPPLACNTAWTHQQPKIATSGYFIWETDRDSKRNSIKCPRSPTNIATDSQRPSPLKRLTRQTSLIWRSTETSASPCKGQQSKGLGPARCNRVRGWDLQNWRRVWLIQRWIKIHAAEKRWPYTCLQTPEWEVRKELRPWGRQFRRRTCDDVGCHILLNWCTSSAILAPLDTDMRFWHHTCCPQWTSVGKFFSTTTLGRTQLWLLLTF